MLRGTPCIYIYLLTTAPENSCWRTDHQDGQVHGHHHHGGLSPGVRQLEEDHGGGENTELLY